MFKAIITGLFKVVLTLIQLIALPFNAIVNNAFPDLSQSIMQVTSSINSLFSSILTFINILPTPVILAITFIFGVEVLLFTTGAVIWGVQKSLTILQKIKFW